MKTKDKPLYGIRQNVCFMVRIAWNTHKSILVMCVIMAALSVAVNLTQLFISPEILARIEKGAPLRELLLTIGLFSGTMFLLSTLQEYLRENRQPAEIDLRTEIINLMNRKTCETSYPNIKNPQMLKLRQQAYDGTTSNLAPTEHIWETLATILTNTAGLIVYLLLLSSFNGFLLTVIVATSLAGFFLTRNINEWEYRHREEHERYTSENHYINSCARSLHLAKDVRIFGLGSWLRELQDKSIRLYSAFVARREKAILLAGVVDVMLTFLRNGVAYAYLIHQTLEQGLPASSFLLYFSAVGGFTGWIKGILFEFSYLHRESIALSRIQEYLNYPEPFRFDGGAQPPLADAYELRLDNVTFRYPETDKNILEHVNLTIHPGEKLAIVGLNGAGKTTLVKLLCGFYDPTEGRVLLNGQDVRDFNRRQYYQLFSAVFQEFSVLDTTLAEAVAQSAENVDTDRVAQCLEQAGLKETVAAFPKGTETHIGREVFLDGVMLSGGQMQRLMLARALYKNGPILVLDEPTAALDPLAENDIYMKYNEMTKGKTSVFISHRLASTRFCDRILFIADGSIAEEGSHDELLALGGAYASLFEVQSRYYKEGGVSDEA